MKHKIKNLHLAVAIIIVLAFLVLASLLIFGTKPYYESILEEDSHLNYKIGNGVIEQFKDSSRTSVTIVLNCSCNYSYDGSGGSDHNYDVYKKCGEAYIKQEHEVISTFNEDEFKLGYTFNSFCGFSGYFSVEGINKLKRNPMVTNVQNNKIELGTWA
jgi:hypothetical protein